MRRHSLLHRYRILNAGTMGLLALLLAACGDGSTVLIGGSVASGAYLVSGKISGLRAGQQITLLNNATDPIMLSSAGVFTFPNPVPHDGTYAITVGTQPAGETCTVSAGSGAGVTANIDSIIVTCSSDTLSIGGAVLGLSSGQQISLLNNGADALRLTANGAFRFSTSVAYNSSYAVTVGTQPAAETCTVSGGSGAGVTASITGISVSCSARTFSIGGSVSGLTAGQQLTLDNNGSNPTTLAGNGAFTFTTPVAYDASYAVTVGTQPTEQNCSVSGASGAGITGGITTVVVSCAADAGYTISGTIAGLASGTQVTLSNNGADSTTVGANGAFSFATRVVLDGSYSVTVGTQPIGQTCTVSGGGGSGVTADVSGIAISCSTNTFSISGSMSGLANGQQVTLDNNGADPTTLTENGAFTFSGPVAFDGSYAVTVGTEPTGQTCSVSGGGGSGVTANITAVTVACSTSTYLIGGTVAGLAGGQQVTLYNNGADPVTPTANGAFTFATAVAYNGSYAVTVGTQPTGQTCSVSGGGGSGVTANVASVTVTCSSNAYTIGGSMSGLAGGQQVTLLNNGADPTTLTAAGQFTFANSVVYGGGYAVSVGTEPTGQTCTITSGSGMNLTAAVTTVTVTCSTNTFSIGGAVSGLGNGLQLTLLNNGANTTTLAGNGVFNFSTPVVYNGSYAVTVGTQPVGQSCTVTAGSGINVESNITGVAVNCVASPTYSVSGSVTGIGGHSLTLENNGANPVVYNANGPYTFLTGVAAGGSYSLTVSTQPTGGFLECFVSNGVNSNVAANATNVTVYCILP